MLRTSGTVDDLIFCNYKEYAAQTGRTLCSNWLTDIKCKCCSL